jgi:single-stranded-DNA-specific exonuclease
LEFCKDLLEKHGGYKAAGGFTLKAENLELFGSRLCLFANQCLQPEQLKPLIKIDVEASLEHISYSLYAQIDALHPCGIENPEPIFWSPNVYVCDQKMIGKGHLKLTIHDETLMNGQKFQAIAWRWGDYYPLPNRLDIAYRLRTNEWNGELSLELELVGARLPTSTPGTEFIHNDRSYICNLTCTGSSKELRIHNGDGRVLIVQQGQRIGTLSKGWQEALQVDVSKAPYFSIIKAALSALEHSSPL